MANPTAPAIDYDEFSVNRLDSWSVNSCKAALRDHEIGNFGRSALLIDAFGRCSDIASAKRTRVDHATGLPFELLATDAEGLSEPGEEAAKDVRVWWADCVQTAEVKKLLGWGIMLGVGVAEINWQFHANAWTPSIKAWHPEHLRLDPETRLYTMDTKQGPIPIVPGRGKWILYAPGGGDSWMEGAVRYLAAVFLILSFADVDWAHWSEVHGHPTRLAKFPSGAKDPDKNLFFNQLLNIGRRALLLLPQHKEGAKELSYALELLEAKDTAWEGFKELIMRNIMAVNVGLLGQTLTSGSGDGKGSYALGKVHADTLQTLISADVGGLAHCLRRDLLAPWALYNRGDRRLAPVPFWDPLTIGQRKAEVEILSKFSEACVRANATTDVDFKAEARRLRIRTMDRIPTIGTPPPILGQ